MGEMMQMKYKGKIYDFFYTEEEKQKYEERRNFFLVKKNMRKIINKQINQIIYCIIREIELEPDLLILKKVIENQFTEKMNWRNYPTYWEIDHIKPLSRFNTVEGLKIKGNKLSNLQPVPASFNHKKGNSNIIFKPK